MNAQDLQRIRVSEGWQRLRVERLRDTSAGDVVVKGAQRAGGWGRWLLLWAVAALAGLKPLRSAPPRSAARTQAHEIERLRSLARAGIAVPAVLHVEPGFFVMRHCEGQRLDQLLAAADERALQWWQRGLEMLLAVHLAGQYLGQAFARNFIGQDDRLVALDFEDDPLAAMSLPQAQARDWMAYLHSSARALRALPPTLHDTLPGRLRAVLAQESAAVRAELARAARRLAWVQRLDAGDGRGWRRHIAIAQAAVQLAGTATDTRGREAASPNYRPEA